MAGIFRSTVAWRPFPSPPVALPRRRGQSFAYNTSLPCVSLHQMPDLGDGDASATPFLLKSQDVHTTDGAPARQP
ncbi:MAG: hypothetical protein NVSMB22_14530 [Chloroflexota bacterium]